MALRAVALCALAVLLMAPLASAHTRFVTPDGQVKIVVGNLNEPVTTYMKTGLDLIITDNKTGADIGGLAGSLQGTLTAPDGSTLSNPIVLQFGTVGHYTFSAPYYLTQPGQYTLHLTGTIQSTAVDNVLNVAGPIAAMENLTFPNDHSGNPAALHAQIASLDGEVAAMKVRLNALEAKGSKGAPSLSAVPAFVLLLAAVAVAARRRTD